MAYSNWDTTAANNNDAAPNGFPEGMAGSAVNDAARQFMADAASLRDDVESGAIFSTGNTEKTVRTALDFTKGADVASGSALALGDDGNYFDITGTTTITSIATWNVGDIAYLHFDDVLTLTHHASNLILPDAANITTATGDQAAFIEYASGQWRCLWYTYSTTPTTETPFPPGHKSGFEYSINASDSDHDVDITAGYARDSTDSVNMTGSAMTKKIDVAWAAGDNAGGLFAGTVSSDTTYYLFIIVKDSDSSVDYGFDTSSVAANIPSGYTKYLKIGQVLTDGSANLVNSINGAFKSPIFWTADNAASTAYNHGLGAVPTTAILWGIRKTASGNWAVGDRVPLGTANSSASNNGYQLIATATDIYVAIGSAGVLVFTDPGTTNTYTTTNNTDWDYQITAEIHGT